MSHHDGLEIEFLPQQIAISFLSTQAAGFRIKNGQWPHSLTVSNKNPKAVQRSINSLPVPLLHHTLYFTLRFFFFDGIALVKGLLAFRETD